MRRAREEKRIRGVRRSNEEGEKTCIPLKHRKSSPEYPHSVAAAIECSRGEVEVKKDQKVLLGSNQSLRQSSALKTNSGH